MPPILRIKLLGDFGLTYGGEPVTGVDSARLQALLAYLVLHADAPQQRRHLAFSFWPDSSEKQARTNLRQLLHHLRHALPDAECFIEGGTQTLQWRAGAPFTLDVSAFEGAVSLAERARAEGDRQAVRRALKESVTRYTGDLVPGCYDAWIEPVRERLRQQYFTALEHLVRLLEEQRAYTEAIHYAERLLQGDALRETTYRTLMHLHALRNDRASALRVYQRCEEMLEEELGVEPDPATRTLHQRLLDLREPAQRASGGWTPGTEAELPLIGRQPEWGRLRSAWHRATHEQAHLASVVGEAGTGKTRLAEELLTWAARQGVTTAWARCYAAEGRLAFAPIADWLRAEPFRTALQTLEPAWRIEVGRILPEALTGTRERPSNKPLPESWQRRLFFESLARAVLAAAQPIALFIDDLQWCDRDTLEWLHFLLRFDPGAQLLLLGTVRIEEVEPGHPLAALLMDLRRSGLVTEIPLGPLDEADTTALAGHLSEHEIGPEQAAHLYRETEGNPLFVVESLRAGRMAAEVSPEKTPPEFSASVTGARTLPPRVHAVLTARLAQCTPLAREVAYLASVVGRAFSFGLLAEASGRNEDALMQGLDELWRRRIVRAHGPNTYDFGHDKLREVAYAAMSPVQRHRLHGRVAEALKTLHASSIDGFSGRLAAHYEQAGAPKKAFPFYLRAARVAQRVYANEETITLLRHARALLAERPPSPQRDQDEIALFSVLIPSLFAARGYGTPEVNQACTRAYTLIEHIEDPDQRFAVLSGLCAHRVVRAELKEAHALNEQLLELAQEQQAPSFLVHAHFEMGVILGHLGDFGTARTHLERALHYYQAGQDHDCRLVLLGSNLGVFGLCYLSHTLWHLGYPDQALLRARAAIALAKKLEHPFSTAIALSYLTMLHQFRGEPEAVLEHAAPALALCTEHHFPYYRAWEILLQGWALHQQGEHEEGRSRLRRGLADLRGSGTGLRAPYYLGLLAEACRREGRTEEGLEALAEALAVTQQTDERWQEAELHRINGALCLQQDEAAAEAAFQRALALARDQHARPLALRAALSLSRLWQATGRTDEARTLMQEQYNVFSEGFDTPDLREAAVLLQALSR